MTKADLEERNDQLTRMYNDARAERDDAKKVLKNVREAKRQLEIEGHLMSGEMKAIKDEIKWLRGVVNPIVIAPKVCKSYAPYPNSTAATCMYCGKMEWEH